MTTLNLEGFTSTTEAIRERDRTFFSPPSPGLCARRLVTGANRRRLAGTLRRPAVTPDRALDTEKQLSLLTCSLMERTNYQASNCSIGRTLQVVGEKWTLLIIRESFYGATRFEQFHRVLQCPRNLLSERLTLLVDEGILERSEYREPGSRARKEYRLTDTGRELAHIMLALQQWGDRHKADPEGPPVVARHAGCGRDVHVTFVCDKGHIVTEPDDVEMVDGPGALPPLPA
jgi:DNA-binding HxlR family transcriptional regulator